MAKIRQIWSHYMDYNHQLPQIQYFMSGKYDKGNTY